jgi:competence protein ComEC
MATLSLIVFDTPVSKLISFVPQFLRQDLSTSLAAQIGVVPLLLYHFGYVNILSPLINAVVLWTIPIITVLGMIAGIVGLVIPLIGRLILLLIYPLSTWFVMIVELV